MHRPQAAPSALGYLTISPVPMQILAAKPRSMLRGWPLRTWAQLLGKSIEVIIGYHQNKPDIASAIARRWIDVDGVSAIAELTNSAVALAVQQIAKEQGKITLFTGPATTRLTNEDCSATGFQWAF